MKRLQQHALLLFVAVAFLAAGCADSGEQPEPFEDDTVATDVQPAVMAVADLQPTEGNDISGRVSFTQEPGGVQVIADVRGLSEGQHGFHVHENGDCGDNAQAAGGHYNPGNDPHGAPTDPPSEHHTGDMGNITADASGTARLDTTFSFLSLEGDTAIVGKALIVHGGRDDLTSQPSGDAGARVACAVIEMQDGGAGMAADTSMAATPSPNETY